MRNASLLLVAAGLVAGPLQAQTRADRREFRNTDWSKHTVPLDEIVSGGPPRDGIPPIDHPQFETVREADRWLRDREPVVVVEHEGEAKAYPLQILIWHEIVNDEVGGRPVSITFCPLCNTAITFDRRFDGRVLDFGTTGRLRHSDLVMYDRQTETWWQQAIGEGIVGEYAGEMLDFVYSPILDWETFRESFPNGRVLSRDTGHRRSYGTNPYVRYDSARMPFPSFFRRRTDGRLPAMERVVAIDHAREPLAIAFSKLEDDRVVQEDVGDVPVVAFWAPGTASALDAERIAEGRDVGSTATFDRRLDDRTLRFRRGDRDGRFVDRETGSTWDMFGRALAGPLQGRRLKPVVHANHFWFAWGVFKPETRVVK